MSTAERPQNLATALREALVVAMDADPDVCVLGTDVGEFGGVFRVTSGLLERFGKERVIDMPLDPAGVVGTAIGMALYGLRPVAEVTFADLAYGAFEQLVSELARVRYRSNGQLSCPVVVRMAAGAGVGGGIYHSAHPEAHFVHTPGLVVVCPSTPADAKGLLLSALRGADPVIFLEPQALYRRAGGDAPEGDAGVPLGVAREVRAGSDLTIVAWGAMVRVCEEAAAKAAADGVECQIIDPRTLWPLDLDAIAAGVAATGRCLIVHEAPRSGGLGAEITALVQERCFLHLEAPVTRVTGLDTPAPASLEEAYLPSVARVLAAIDGLIGF